MGKNIYPDHQGSWRNMAVLSTALLMFASLEGQTETLTFAIIGDYGMANDTESKVAAMVKSWNPEFIVTTGDNYYKAAGKGSDNPFHASHGQYYCDFMKDVAGSGDCSTGKATINRFFPTLGNHDYVDVGNADALPSVYAHYFTLPGAGIAVGSVPSHNERYYDFIWGPVQFFMLNSGNRVSGNNCIVSEEPDGCSGASTQAQWLRNALAASTAPWKVAIIHKPPFSSDIVHSDTELTQWPYEAWGADLVVSGHSHTYERIIRDENSDSRAIPYIVNGLGGDHSPYPFGVTVAGSQFRYNSDGGAMRVTVSDTRMTLEFYAISNTLEDAYQLPAKTRIAGEAVKQ